MFQFPSLVNLRPAVECPEGGPDFTGAVQRGHLFCDAENLTVALDTSFPVDLLRGRKDATALLAELEGGGRHPRHAALTTLELYQGSFLSADPEKSMAAAKKILGSFIRHFALTV